MSNDDIHLDFSQVGEAVIQNFRENKKQNKTKGTYVTFLCEITQRTTKDSGFFVKCLISGANKSSSLVAWMFSSTKKIFDGLQ